MNDLMRCLYHFALETHMEPIAEDREYQAGLDAITAQENRVRAGMDEEQRRALKLLIAFPTRTPWKTSASSARR
jgi:hypothetical protein